MPLPAGTGLSRRSFLLHSSVAMLSVYGASRLGLGGIESGIAQAAGSGERTLVSIFLEGGIDSISVLAPVTDPLYRSLRPTLALGEGEGTPFSEDPGLRWHPAAASLDQLHRAGKVAVLPAVGYADADQSHFTSRHYWEVGTPNAGENTGWMGRLLDLIGTDDNPLQGLSLDGLLSPALASGVVPVSAIDGPAYALSTKNVIGPPAELMFDSVQRLGLGADGDAGRETAGSAASQAMQLRRELAPFSETTIAQPVPYPEGDDDTLPSGLAALSAMLAAGLPIRCAAISSPNNFDTHASQRETFAGDLRFAADSIAAFQADLEARGVADRVLTLVWSEFGRRPKQNDNGTDHGAAGVGFVIGSRVRGQMIGEFPGLAQLDEDENLRMTSDFRSLYCSIVEQWFGVDAAAVIPGAAGLTRPGLIL